jgi:nitrile hydratase
MRSMDGIHDMGGMQGFGAIPTGPDGAATFAEDWQRRVFGLAVVGGLANIDAFRHAIERTDPLVYLSAGYWGRWLAALELVIAENDESIRPTDPLARRAIESEPVFSVGDRVRARDMYVSGHTRLPAYARGRRGIVDGVRGGWVFPDTHAHGRGENPQHVYGVRFEARELWGQTAESGTMVFLDLFESYLESDES